MKLYKHSNASTKTKTTSITVRPGTSARVLRQTVCTPNPEWSFHPSWSVSTAATTKRNLIFVAVNCILCSNFSNSKVDFDFRTIICPLYPPTPPTPHPELSLFQVHTRQDAAEIQSQAPSPSHTPIHVRKWVTSITKKPKLYNVASLGSLQSQEVK